jgi:hypothetical protein
MGMKRFQQNAVILAAVVIGSLIGAVKGHEARQKWVFRFMSKKGERQARAIKKQDAKSGKVILDDIEMAAFHNG